MREIFEDVGAGDDTDRAIATDRDDRRGIAGQEREGLVEARVEGDQRQWPVHHLANGPLDDGRVAERAVEEALLGDRPDDTLDRVAVGQLRDRQLTDPELLEELDRL